MPEKVDLIRLAASLVESLIAVGDETLLGAGRLLSTRVADPRVFVTLVGETSSGKSTLLNGLLGTALLPTGVAPTTGVVVQILAEPRDEARLLAINRDGTQEDLARADFRELSRHPDDALLRLQVRTNTRYGLDDGLVLIDTPGFNSVLGEHEEVLRRFIPESDAVVFVTSYRNGFSQVDQDLFEVVREATQDDPDLPFLLVVNRVPDGVATDDKRIQEMSRNANDSMLRELHPLLISEQAPEDGGAALPQGQELWEAVRAISRSEARLNSVRAKLREALCNLAEEAAAAVQRELLLMMATQDERRAIDLMVAELRDARTQSLAAVARCTHRLSTLIPPTVASEHRRIAKTLRAQVVQTDKWFGKDDCASWVQYHSLPYECRQASRAVEGVIQDQLQRLNEELQDIANTAIEKLTGHAQVRSGVARDFAFNLGKTLSMRVGGAAASGFLRSFGGVGGAAAGAGNLVKMLVSRFGRLFGKTFGREVYRQIGKTFTKRFLQRANVVFSVVVEAYLLKRDIDSWQANLADKVDEALDAWATEITEVVLREHLPGLEQANIAGVKDIYDELLEEADTPPATADEEERAMKEHLLSQILAIKGTLEPTA